MSNSYNVTVEEDYEENEKLAPDQGQAESCRDFIGQGVLHGIEGTMVMHLNYFGVTEEYQKDIINSVLIEFGSKARELLQDLVDARVEEILKEDAVD